ncbi:MAG: hypothetical protein HYU53_17015 [Acidobacteria bacterium]|nr:hypothetical protein [Acidobacteriota bacterium]
MLAAILTIASGVALGNLISEGLIAAGRENERFRLFTALLVFVLFLGGVVGLGYVFYTGGGSRLLNWLQR